MIMTPNHYLFRLLMTIPQIEQTITTLFLGWYANVRVGWGRYKCPEALQVRTGTYAFQSC